MNILFITLAGIQSIEQRGIYPDLLKHFEEQGHHVTVVSPIERRAKKGSFEVINKSNHILRVWTPNIQKANFVEKSIGTLAIDYLFRNALKKYIKKSHFDLVIYTTPPITLINTIRFIKSKYNCTSYLLLKDIFPQNAVDLGMMRRGSLFYKYFRNKEKELYALTDIIGCMSQANVQYILDHNQLQPYTKIEVCPNSIRPTNILLTKEEKIQKRVENGIPIDKRIFVYGGNLGKPQGMDFILEFLTSQLSNENAYFVIMGSGTAFPQLKRWESLHNPANVLITGQLPKDKYDDFQKIGDVGLIFLDERFTIPNFPSRLLTYIDDAMPVIAAVDKHTDIGLVIEKNNFGKSSLAGDLETLNNNIDYMCNLSEAELRLIGKNARDYLLQENTVEQAYQIIMNSVHEKSGLIASKVN